MNKKEAEVLTNDILIADALLRIRTIENILILKGICTKEEYQLEMASVTDLIAKSILQKAGVPGNLDEIIQNLRGHNILKGPQK